MDDSIAPVSFPLHHLGIPSPDLRGHQTRLLLKGHARVSVRLHTRHRRASAGAMRRAANRSGVWTVVERSNAPRQFFVSA